MTQFALVTTSKELDSLQSVESFGDEFFRKRSNNHTVPNYWVPVPGQ
jgi:hypothetical protein